MNTPTTKLDFEIISKLKDSGICTNIEERWETGIDHHPESEKLARELASIDWLFCDDSMCLKFGGDGDNGESLMYMLDIIFELRDKTSRLTDIEPDTTGVQQARTNGGAG